MIDWNMVLGVFLVGALGVGSVVIVTTVARGVVQGGGFLFKKLAPFNKLTGKQDAALPR